MSLKPWDDSIPRSALIASWSILLAWVLSGAAFVYTAPAFMDSTGASLDPPKGSRSAVAEEMYSTYFKEKLPDAGDLILIVISSPSNVTNSGVTEYSQWVRNTLQQSVWQKDYGLLVGGYYLPSLDGGPVTWMLSDDNSTTVLALQATKSTGSQQHAFDFVDYLTENITIPSRIPSDNATYTINLVGSIVLDKEVQGKAEASLRNMELTVLPFAFLVLAYFLQHIQLLVVPLVCMSLSLGTAFTLALPIARRWGGVSSETPEVMVSCAAALSIDYSLFLLTRFLEGVGNGLSMWQSIVDMVIHTGHTICVSGLLISLAFFSGLLMPIQTIRSAGACTGITALSTVLIDITLIPALLVCFGKALTYPLSTPVLLLWDTLKFRLKGMPGKTLSVDDGRTAEPQLYICNGDESDEEPITKPKTKASGLWMRLALLVKKHAGCVIIIVLLMGIPLLIQVPKMSVSADRSQTRPRGAESLEVMREMEVKGMETARSGPVNLIVNGNDMMSSEGYKALVELGHAVLDSLKETASVVRPDMLQGPSFAWGQELNYTAALSLLHSNSTLSQPYEALLERMVSEDGNVTLTQVYTTFPSCGPKAAPWLRKVRKVIDKFNEKWGDEYTAHVAAPSAGDIDSSDLVEEKMPMILICIVCSVTVIVGAVFRSVFLPLRLAFALAYTVFITLGVAVVVYQTKTFWWLFPYLEDFDNEGLSYTVPAVVIPVCIALGLDYDIFLITRIAEYRAQGMPNDAAVIMGTATTGPTISGAGVIMSIAFGGLLSSSETMLNQFGLILTVSVLLDTFVIRTVFVPALMIKADKLNWWPRSMPQPHTDECSHVPVLYTALPQTPSYP
eukprot:TRINITY_DN3886_c0_g3_i1.p1 TRINITY_DN3886_c0_g3~~TRINITY_DN3886_c0_g3_i1.p1  ORF type:complete len:845 (+),score=110.00 TRINITY_DN3886_c0_g3_i1:31-2565(+)